MFLDFFWGHDLLLKNCFPCCKYRNIIFAGLNQHPVITYAKTVSFFSRFLYIFNHVHPGSMLHAMFSGRFDTKPSEDGSYFIDRDGTHFRYILNYLRTGQLIVPKDEIIREELLAEAEFYQVEGIIKALTARLLQDSVILSSEKMPNFDGLVGGDGGHHRNG